MAGRHVDAMDTSSDSDSAELIRPLRATRRSGHKAVLLDSDDDDDDLQAPKRPPQPLKRGKPACAAVKKEDSDREAGAILGGPEPFTPAPQGPQGRPEKRGHAKLEPSREVEADAHDTDGGCCHVEAAAAVSRRRLRKSSSLAVKGSVSDVDVEDSDSGDELLAWGVRKQRGQKPVPRPAKRVKSGEPHPRTPQLQPQLSAHSQLKRGKPFAHVHLTFSVHPSALFTPLFTPPRLPFFASRSGGVLQMFGIPARLD